MTLSEIYLQFIRANPQTTMYMTLIAFGFVLLFTYYLAKLVLDWIYSLIVRCIELLTGLFTRRKTQPNDLNLS